jgi:hypothetical protein
MDELTYTKGIYTATAAVRRVGQDQFQGVVTLQRDDGGDTENTVYEVESASPGEAEALEEAKALAHRILGEIEL